MTATIAAAAPGLISGVRPGFCSAVDWMRASRYLDARTQAAAAASYGRQPVTQPPFEPAMEGVQAGAAANGYDGGEPTPEPPPTPEATAARFAAMGPMSHAAVELLTRHDVRGVDVDGSHVHAAAWVWTWTRHQIPLLFPFPPRGTIPGPLFLRLNKCERV